jgi:hypothetical protein
MPKLSIKIGACQAFSLDHRWLNLMISSNYKNHISLFHKNLPYFAPNLLYRSKNVAPQ